MRSTLNQLHENFGTCRQVAAYLGYTLRAYMKIRRRVYSDEPLSLRVEILIRHKLSKLADRPKTKSKGVATVTKHISNNSNNGGAGFQKEFNKASRKIQSLLQAGKSRKDAHERLTHAGRITMSYSRFCGLIAKELENNPQFLAPPPVKPDSRKRGAPSTSRTSKR